MHVNLLDYTSGEKRIMAVIRVANGQMQIEGTIPPRIQHTLEFEQQHWSAKGLDDEALLRKLPQLVSGTYTRAQLIREKKRTP